MSLSACGLTISVKVARSLPVSRQKSHSNQTWDERAPEDWRREIIGEEPDASHEAADCIQPAGKFSVGGVGMYFAEPGASAVTLNSRSHLTCPTIAPAHFSRRLPSLLTFTLRILLSNFQSLNLINATIRNGYQGWYQWLWPHWPYRLPQRVGVSWVPSSTPGQKADHGRPYSVEHGEVDVVAVNDPFIDTQYAVSRPLPTSESSR